MKLMDHKDAIFAIRDHNKVGYDVATEMFLNNIEDAGRPDDQHVYHGADHVDYKALQPHLGELEASKQEFIDHFQPRDLRP